MRTEPVTGQIQPDDVGDMSLVLDDQDETGRVVSHGRQCDVGERGCAHCPRGERRGIADGDGGPPAMGQNHDRIAFGPPVAGRSYAEQDQLIEPARVRPAEVCPLNDSEPPVDVIAAVVAMASTAYVPSADELTETVTRAG